jgi:hypothetical protein
MSEDRLAALVAALDDLASSDAGVDALSTELVGGSHGHI